MASNDLLKKISLDGIDTKGLYLKDTANLFKNDNITKNELKKIDYAEIMIIARLYFRNKQIVKTLKFRNITGLQAVKYAVTKRNEFLSELQDTGIIKKKIFKSLNELWSDYTELKSKSLSEKNIYTTQKSYDKWIEPQIGSMEVTKIMTSDIQDIVNTILRQGLKPRTAQTIKQILRPLFNYSIDIGLSETNPAIKVNLPYFDNTVDFNLSDEKRKKLYEEILKYTPLKYRGIMLLVFLGRRLNEALTLRWENIHFEQNKYTIEAQYSKIRRRQDYRLSEPLKVFFKEYGDYENGFIFPGETTPYITSNTFRRHWKQVIKNAGIDYMRIHDTRHVLGNYTVDNGGTLESAGKLLGHSGIGVTKRYAKVSLETADIVLDEYVK